MMLRITLFLLNVYYKSSVIKRFFVFECLEKFIRDSTLYYCMFLFHSLLMVYCCFGCNVLCLASGNSFNFMFLNMFFFLISKYFGGILERRETLGLP